LHSECNGYEVLFEGRVGTGPACGRECSIRLPGMGTAPAGKKKQESRERRGVRGDGRACYGLRGRSCKWPPCDPPGCASSADR
jgi:hypothetical protein